jgi:hypothetical protein
MSGRSESEVLPGHDLASQVTPADGDLTILRSVLSESVSGESSTSSSKEEKEGSMEVDDGDAEDAEPTKASDPNDLSAYNLDNYDKEVSRGTGQFFTSARSSMSV